MASALEWVDVIGTDDRINEYELSIEDVEYDVATETATVTVGAKRENDYKIVEDWNTTVRVDGSKVNFTGDFPDAFDYTNESEIEFSAPPGTPFTIEWEPASSYEVDGDRVAVLEESIGPLHTYRLLDRATSVEVGEVYEQQVEVTCESDQGSCTSANVFAEIDGRLAGREGFSLAPNTLDKNIMGTNNSVDDLDDASFYEIDGEELVFTESGEYTVDIYSDDGQLGESYTVEVTGGPEFEVSCSLSGSEVVVGDTLTVEATVENVGTSTGEVDVEPTIDGEPAGGVETVEVSAGSSEIVEFDVEFDSAGDYGIGVDATRN